MKTNKIKRVRKILKYISFALLIVLIIGMVIPTWTPHINGVNSISELRKIAINDTKLEVMIRGEDKNNPIIIFVHGGPCCSEIPYVRKYQREWEKDFTIVHYDQRGCGKSYSFGVDYSDVKVSTHVEDLIALSKYIQEYLGQEQVILAGHSFGTYIGTLAVAERPKLYQAYIGIGQMSNGIESELYNLDKCIMEAEKVGNEKDVEYLKSLEPSVASGEIIVPRNYVRKYGYAARHISETGDYLSGFFFGTEYNLLDAIRYYTAIIKYQGNFEREATEAPLSETVLELQVPVYFVMGKYDGMTSPEAAEEYLNSITGTDIKEFILFKDSAHYPQFEEGEAFNEWLCETFIE